MVRSKKLVIELTEVYMIMNGGIFYISSNLWQIEENLKRILK